MYLLLKMGAIVTCNEGKPLAVDLGNTFVTQTNKKHYVELSEKTKNIYVYTSYSFPGLVLLQLTYSPERIWQKRHKSDSNFNDLRPWDHVSCSMQEGNKADFSTHGLESLVFASVGRDQNKAVLGGISWSLETVWGKAVPLKAPQGMPRAVAPHGLWQSELAALSRDSCRNYVPFKNSCEFHFLLYNKYRFSKK